MDFPEFEGDEGSGEDGGEVLGPTFAEGQADALGEGESGVEEGAEANLSKALVVDVDEAGEEAVNEEVAGVDAEGVDPVGGGDGDVLMEESEGADADGEEEQAFR